MKKTRLLWFLLTTAFIVLSFVTEFDGGGQRRPSPQPKSVPEPTQRFGDQRADDGPVRRWLLEADTDRVRSTGTAFAIAGGLWLTARHVVDQCDSIWIVKPGRPIKPDQKVRKAILHPKADIALLHFPLAPGHPPVVTAPHQPRRKAAGFHFGYPGGNPGDVLSFYLGDSAATIRGRGAATFPIQVWAAKEIPARLTSLGGLSGGPAFDETGRIIGVTIAESPRRGRVATTPATLSGEMIDLAGVARQVSTDNGGASRVEGLAPATYHKVGDALRASLAVAQVYCHVRLAGRSSPFDRF